MSKAHIMSGIKDKLLFPTALLVAMSGEMVCFFIPVHALKSK
jgi:hypothetical protein